MRPRAHPGVAHLIVSKDTLRRALLYLQAIFSEAERRGWAIEPSEGYESTGVSIVVRGHAYPLSMHELHEREPMTPDDISRWRKAKEWRLRWNPELQPPAQKSVPNGYLKLSSPNWHGGRSSWSEGPRGPLDRKLPQFFEELEQRAEADDHRAEERRREIEARRRREQLELERQRLARRDEERMTRLAREISAWQLAGDARAYIEALRATLDDLDPDTRSRVREWCDWAENWAAKNDPVANPDSLRGLTEPLGE
jgi:hypothetical protein